MTRFQSCVLRLEYAEQQSVCHVKCSHKYLRTCGNRYCKLYLQAGLLDRLLDITPESLTRFSFANSGAEAVENAIKVARAYTGKQNVIAFDVSTSPLSASIVAEEGIIGMAVLQAFDITRHIYDSKE